MVSIFPLQFLVSKGVFDLDGAGVATLLATLPMLVVSLIGSRIAARLGWRAVFA